MIFIKKKKQSGESIKQQFLFKKGKKNLESA